MLQDLGAKVGGHAAESRTPDDSVRGRLRCAHVAIHLHRAVREDAHRSDAFTVGPQPRLILEARGVVRGAQPLEERQALRAARRHGVHLLVAEVPSPRSVFTVPLSLL